MLAQFWKSGGHVKPSGLQVGLLAANMGPKEGCIGGQKFETPVRAWFFSGFWGPLFSALEADHYPLQHLGTAASGLTA